MPQTCQQSWTIAFREVLSRAGGYSLIELMVVLTVASILAAIVYPVYRSQVEHTRRADAQGVLMQNAQLMERFYTENGRYDQDAEGAAPQILGRSPVDPGYPAYYAMAFADASPTQTTFRIQATPVGPEAGAGSMDIDETGLRRWDRNKNGVFEADEVGWDRR